MATAATLLIDDDLGFSTGVLRAFDKEGLKLDWVESWDKGLELFRVVLHELVVADYNLPRSLLGLKLLAKIKPLRPSSRLVLVSGALTSKAEEILRQTELVDRYLPKGSGLAEELLQEAGRAENTARQPSDWYAIAAGHLAAQDVYADDIERIDALLQGELQNP